jgi:hypothetical protein
MVNGPARHPDDDLLADLVADALSLETARAVESHVLECQECASLLADAEHVRGLLARQDPGPMPAGAHQRIESAIRFEARAHAAPATGTFTRETSIPPAALSTPTTWSDTETIEAYRSVMDRGPGREPADDQFPVRSPATGSFPRPDVPEPDSSGVDPHSPESSGSRSQEEPAHGRFTAVREGFASRAPRMSRGSSRSPSRSRRDIRQEVRDVRSGRRGTKIATVAGVIIVVSLTAFAVKGFFWSSTSDVQAGDAGTSLNLSESGSRVVTTGTAYTSDALADQAHELMELMAGANSTESGAPQATVAEGAGTRSLDGPAVGNLGLRDPAQLDGCLTALQAGSKEPVAVDLATYDNQEAAIIVLLGEGGGYEVWVVARTCSASSEETMRFLQLPA